MKNHSIYQRTLKVIILVCLFSIFSIETLQLYCLGKSFNKDRYGGLFHF